MSVSTASGSNSGSNSGTFSGTFSAAADEGGIRKRTTTTTTTTTTTSAKSAAAAAGDEKQALLDSDPAAKAKLASISASISAAVAVAVPPTPVPSPHIPTLLILTALAFFTRFYKLSWANFVVWDEAHFGKFASYYIKREFYHDVHPPLGKMLLGFAGLVAGYNGTFEFESGATYPPELNYTIMRMFAASFGAWMVPLAYLTAVQLHFSHAASVLAGVMVLTDLATVTISRFILLDSMLLFFTSLSLYTLVVFRNYQRTEPFSEDWWIWLAFNGVSIGCVLSVKWVGLFAIALVGLNTIEDLWTMWGDLKMPKLTYAKHWIARIVFLILVPAAVYTTTFVAHFAILNRSGSGDANMSSLFQAGLIGNNFDDNPLELAFGSRATFKNNGPGGGLLHSHVQTFVGGSEQQQVTCYHHKDANNEWIVYKPWDKLNETKPDGEVEFIKDGDVIRLVHSGTKRNLHSHHIPAPVTSSENEVSAYGDLKIGDVHDHWRVEFHRDITGNPEKRVRSLSTQFRLRHVVTGCLLRSHSVPLPAWGFKQNEVVCEKKGDKESPFNLWNVENHWNDALPPAGPGVYKSKFWADFWHLNVAMWTTNNALTPDNDKEPDQLVSKPYHWPLSLVGLRMCSWDNDAVKFYLLGHPLIWWGSAAAIVGFVFVCLFYMIRAKRHYNDWTKMSLDDFAFAGKVSWGGWFLHYFPFWIMGRVCYLHHYFPALYFGIFMLSHTLDHLCLRAFPSSPTTRNAILSLVAAVIVAVFIYFADFSFGFTGDAVAYKDRQWLKSWNVYEGWDHEDVQVEEETE